MRGALAGFLVVLSLLATMLAATVLVLRNGVADPQGLAEAGASALRSPDGRRVVTDTTFRIALRELRAAGVPEPKNLRALIDGAVGDALAQPHPALEASVGQALEQAVAGDAGTVVEIDVSELQPEIQAAVLERAPELAPLLAQSGVLEGTVELDLTELAQARRLRQVREARQRFGTDSGLALAGLAAALLALALCVARDRGATARVAGSAIVVLAVWPPLLAYGAPEILGAVAGAGLSGELARQLAGALIAEWQPVSIGMAIAGAIIAAFGLVLRN